MLAIHPLAPMGLLMAAPLLALVMLALGALFYKEQLSFGKLLGVAFCAVGLFFLNR